MAYETKIKAGQIIFFSTGCYSDYHIRAHLVFRHDCDLELLADEWLKSIQNSLAEFEWASADAFAAWLLLEGHAVPFDAQEFHLGDYSGIEVGRVEASGDAEDWRLLPETTNQPNGETG